MVSTVIEFFVCLFCFFKCCLDPVLRHWLDWLVPFLEQLNKSTFQPLWLWGLSYSRPICTSPNCPRAMYQTTEGTPAVCLLQKLFKLVHPQEAHITQLIPGYLSYTNWPVQLQFAAILSLGAIRCVALLGSLLYLEAVSFKKSWLSCNQVPLSCPTIKRIFKSYKIGTQCVFVESINRFTVD